MQENYRYGIHRAILMVHVTPHRRFYDGHIIQKEFSEGSHTHQTINRLFDTNIRAVVLQATQYQFLEYIADDDETLEVMNDYFMDPDFTSMRFSYVPDPDNDLGGHYVADPNALDEHRLHYCAQEDHHHHHAAAPLSSNPSSRFHPRLLSTTLERFTNGISRCTTRRTISSTTTKTTKTTTQFRDNTIPVHTNKK